MLRLLNEYLEALPSWLEIKDDTTLPNSVTVRTLHIGQDLGCLELLIEASPHEPSVQEVKSLRQKLPDFCLERHIMSDRTFCLGHAEGTQFLNEADQFWRALFTFLENQDYVLRHGVWPIEQGISHSPESVSAQKKIEDLIRADEGLLQEWLEGAFRMQGWVSDFAHRTSSRGPKIVSQRQACPRGCSYSDPHHPGCRLKPAGQAKQKRKSDRQVLMSDCAGQDTIRNIINLENTRWAEDQKLFDAQSPLSFSNFDCCRTMRFCPMNPGA